MLQQYERLLKAMVPRSELSGPSERCHVIRDLEQTPKRYGCGTWRHVIHASQQFEIRKQGQADTDATVVWYRSRPRETSKEQE